MLRRRCDHSGLPACLPCLLRLGALCTLCHAFNTSQMPPALNSHAPNPAQLASPEVKFEIDTETHDPLDVGMYQVGNQSNGLVVWGGKNSGRDEQQRGQSRWPPLHLLALWSHRFRNNRCAKRIRWLKR